MKNGHIGVNALNKSLNILCRVQLLDLSPLYNFDFATSHSTGFFLKKKIYNLIGNYNTKFKISADYDLYLRLYKKNLKGGYTKKNQKIGNMRSGGFSSKVSFFDHLIEETKIRLHNSQNIFFVFLIFINAIFKNILKK